MSGDGHGPTRREILALIGKAALASPALASISFATTRRAQSESPPSNSSDWQLTDAALLEEIVSRAFLYFWYEASPHTGLVRDRALADGVLDPRRISSIAATGFGLAALCIAASLSSFQADLCPRYRNSELFAKPCRTVERLLLPPFSTSRPVAG